MTKLALSTLSAAQLDDKALDVVAGGFFNRSSSSTVKYGPRNSANGNGIIGENNIVSGRDTNIYGGA